MQKIRALIFMLNPLVSCLAIGKNIKGILWVYGFPRW